MMKMTSTKQDNNFGRDALEAGEFDAVIHAALIEIAQYRPLSRAEARLRCLTASRPWCDLKISSSTFYRRLKRPG